MKIKNIVNIIFIFIIIFIIIFCLFIINKNNIDRFTLPTKKARLFKAPFPYGIIGPNVNTDPNSTMQLFNTNGTLSWQQSRDAAKSLGGDLPTLATLKIQLNIDGVKPLNFGESWYPYIDLKDYGWACYQYTSISGIANGTTHISKFGYPPWGITSEYHTYRTHLYVQFVPIKPIVVDKQSVFIDGKKKFNYLTNSNYSKTVFDKYYLNDDQLHTVTTIVEPEPRMWGMGMGSDSDNDNDELPDTIITHERSVKHPYQVKTGEYYGVVGDNNLSTFLNLYRGANFGDPNILQNLLKQYNDYTRIYFKNASNDRYRNFGIRF